jgi:competence protein CoiA
VQLHAFDSDGKLISARQAFRHTDYYCLECEQLVRMRGGPQRRCHFYHLEPTLFCRQHQKGPIHLQLQSYFLQQLPPGDCSLELPFPSIRRIADVAWLSQKIIFEIQCSPISAQEVLARNRDYQSLGWTVIWILHDQRYNQVRLSAAEIALRSSPYFFSNMNDLGSGIIYDQFDICEQGIRHKRLPPLPINLKGEIRNHLKQDMSPYPLILLNQRTSYWKLSLDGDLLSLFGNNPSASYLNQAREIEKQFYSSSIPLKWYHWPAEFWRRAIAAPYQVVFRFLLERMCR